MKKQKKKKKKKPTFGGPQIDLRSLGQMIWWPLDLQFFSLHLETRLYHIKLQRTIWWPLYPFFFPLLRDLVTTRSSLAIQRRTIWCPPCFQKKNSMVATKSPSEENKKQPSGHQVVPCNLDWNIFFFPPK
jgi:hypothetical protein